LLRRTLAPAGRQHFFVRISWLRRWERISRWVYWFRRTACEFPIRGSAAFKDADKCLLFIQPKIFFYKCLLVVLHILVMILERFHEVITSGTRDEPVTLVAVNHPLNVFWEALDDPIFNRLTREQLTSKCSVVFGQTIN